MNKEAFRRSLIESGKFLSVGEKFRDAVNDNADRRSDLGAALYRISVIEGEGGRTKTGNVFCTVFNEGTPQEEVHFEERDLDQISLLPKKPKKPDTAYHSAVQSYLYANYPVVKLSSVDSVDEFAEAKVLSISSPSQGAWLNIVIHGPIGSLSHTVISG
jgi:hypothetical protein